jgi:hypothetical protein
LGKRPPVGQGIGFSVQLRSHEQADIEAGNIEGGVPLTGKIWVWIDVTQEDIDNAHKLIRARDQISWTEDLYNEVAPERKMITLVCLCCGISREFDNSQAAFEAGWDDPEHFTLNPFCDLCPTSLYLLGISHQAAHERWAAQGRPANFTPGTCGTEQEINKGNQENWFEGK